MLKVISLFPEIYSQIRKLTRAVNLILSVFVFQHFLAQKWTRLLPAFFLIWFWWLLKRTFERHVRNVLLCDAQPLAHSMALLIIMLRDNWVEWCVYIFRVPVFYFFSILNHTSILIKRFEGFSTLLLLLLLLLYVWKLPKFKPLIVINWVKFV